MTPPFGGCGEAMGIKQLFTRSSPALVHLELLGQPVEGRLGGVLPRVVEVLAVVPIASLDPPVADHNDAGPGRPSTWSSVRWS